MDVSVFCQLNAVSLEGQTRHPKILQEQKAPDRMEETSGLTWRPLKLASLIGTRVRTVRYLRKPYFRVAQVQGWYPRVGTSRNVVPYVPHQPHPSASSAQSLCFQPL